MAITAQELNIILSARDKQFTKAMDRAQRRVERFANKSKKDLSKTSKAFGGLTGMIGKLGIALSAGAVVSGFARSLDSAMKLSKEISNLSTLAGVSTTEFQRVAFAAKQMGVEQDKVADILKDVNDKFGDFFVTGAGPLADFFENIAPKVGITADAFKNLSSADALGLYVKTLEEAGVNQQELTFFMEALASDATLLAPLLRDNGEAMRTLGDEAQRLGIILDEDVVSNTTKMEKEWSKVVDRMSSKWRNFTLTVGLGLADFFRISDKGQLDALANEVDNVISTLEDLEDTSAGYRESIAEFEDAGVEPLIFTKNLADNERQIRFTRLELMRLKREAENYNPDRNVFDLGSLVIGGGTKEEEPDKKVKLIRGEMVKLGGSMKDLDSIASTLERSFEDVFMSAIDGSKSFKDTLRATASTVIRELYRVLVVQRLVNAAMGFLGVSSGGINVPSGSVPGSASGGAVYPGQATVVGEHGRELFVPSSAGRILSVPQAKAAVGGGDGVVINQTINVTTGVQQTVRNEIKTLMPQIAESAKGAVADAKRRGGSYGRAFS